MGRERQFYRLLREVRIADAPVPDSYIQNARKMPGEVIEVVDAGHQSIQEPLSPSQSHQSPRQRHSSKDAYDQSEVSYLKLAHAPGWIPKENAIDGKLNVELLKETNWNEEVASPHLYFRVLVPLDVRTGPDCIAPKVSPIVNFRPNDIVEASRIVTFPQSTISFIELNPAGWLNVQLPSGRRVLERLQEAPPPTLTRTSSSSVTSNITLATIDGKDGTLEHGHFFYCVKIAVGIREYPDIMGPRVGKGFHLNTIVEGSQRFTPDGSPITYVKLLHERGWVFESTMDGQVVLSPLHSLIQRDITRGFYRVLNTEAGVPVYSAPSFESPILCNRFQVIECRERLRLDVPIEGSSDTAVVTFLKLRHTPGWVPEITCSGNKLVEEIDGDATTIDIPKFYKVQMVVPVRMAPDLDSPRVQGSFPKPIGSIVESSIRHLYTPPESNMTYVKLAHEPGWIFEKNLLGEPVLVALSKEPEKQHGKFFYRTKIRVRVLVSPEPTSAILRHIEENQAFVALLQFCLPDTDITYVGLKDKGWVALDPPSSSKITIEQSVYNLWTDPPSWVAVGFPNRSWYKVPEEPDILALETMLQNEVFSDRTELFSSSQGRDSVPVVRAGRWKGLPVTLEEIKHPANPILLTFPWKQLWWHLSLDSSIVIELQHGLHGGFRAVYCNGVVMNQTRLLWDGGDTFTFTAHGHEFVLTIALEGSFFSTSTQYFCYALSIDGEQIIADRDM
ncbi:hypothetical protein THRCLA_06974 [Thraustotheca clavata]|uniref:Uncharacterized protein n=1 Tax=Thraustotheca clavata TaxID=74557 RepID=A0A1V9ZHE1_9STRA|nr:hypothetical protein THRCLA_06974 [Thraustotheca clavata]